MLALFLLQAATAASPQTIDLLAAPERCRSSEDEVVVCAHRTEQRLEPIAEPVKSGPPDGPLSFRLPGGAQGKAHAIQSTLPGASGQGVAVTVRFPF